MHAWTPTDAPVLTNSRPNCSVPGGGRASATRVSEGRTLGLPEGQKGCWGWGHHPIQDSHGWGGAAGTPWQVHGRVGGRRDPQGVCFVWTQTGLPSLLSLTISTSATPCRQGALVAPSARTPAPSQPQPRPGLGVCELQVRARLQTCRGGGVIALAPSFSTVYNLLLCLHIFSVHIIHQSKKRNYESLDQLSYDHKRGPKVYLHGRARHPRLGSPGRAPRPPGLPWARPRHAAAEQTGRRARSRAGSLGRRGQCWPPGPRPQAARRRSGSLGSACESPGPRVSSRNPGGSPPARLQSSPGRSRRAGGQAPEDLPRFWKRRPVSAVLDCVPKLSCFLSAARLFLSLGPLQLACSVQK